MNRDHWRTPAERNLRLRGFDYRNAETYFVTIVSNHRACLFGAVKDAVVALSPIGEIVRACWLEIPVHFEVRLHASVVMPNHFHGVMTILRRHEGPLPLRGLTPGSLSTIIAHFKAAASRRAGRRIWQPRFHERIVRDAREFDLIEDYIALNPERWRWDPVNPEREPLPPRR